MAFWDKIQNGTPNNSSATKTPYQQVFSQPVQQEWKVGDNPNNYGQALATINAMYKTNPTGAMEKLNLLNQYRTQPGNKWFDPYSVATNNVVGELKSYGIDPAELNDDWFKANTSWQGYLRYNGTTTTPSTPTKKSTAQEKAAYALYQFQNSMGTTNAAKNEWAAAQDELAYWANRKDLNLSDDDIISKVFGSGKYSTLKKMDDSRTTGKPLELNEAIDYNPDSVRGVLWAARNGGGTGNSRQDIANYYSKVGNGWTANEDISAKLNKADLSTYSPHEIGMTGKDMDDVGAYFGVGSFAPGEIEAMRSKVDWDDATSVKMWQKAYGYEQDTLEAEKELAEFNKQFERRLNRGFADQNAADKWIEDQLSSGDFKTLAKMDSGIQKGDPMNLTRAVPYRKQMYQQAAYDAIANPKKSGGEIMESYGMPVSEADRATVKVENENVGNAIDAMGSFLSKGEKDYFDAVPGVEYAKITAGYNGVAEGIKSGMIDIVNNAEKKYAKANNEYAGAVLSSIPMAIEYEKYKDAAARLETSIGAFESANEQRLLANEDIQSQKIVETDDTYVELYMGTDGKYTVNEDTERMIAEGAYEDFRQSNPSITFDECLQKIHEADQKICDEENAHVEAIRKARAETGESGLNTPEEIAQYEKDKETLRTLNDWLKKNYDAYNNALRSVDEMKKKRDAIGDIAAKANGAEYDPSDLDSLISFAGSLYQYEPMEADGYSLVDEITGKSAEDIGAMVKENDKVVADVKFAIEMLGDSIPDDLRKHYDAFLADAERQNRVYNNYLITNDPQFKSLADKGRDEYIDMSDISNVKIGNTQKQWFPLMTPEEMDIYFAIAARDGVEAADQFYLDLRDDLMKRLDIGIENVTKKTAESGALGRLTSEVLAILPAGFNALAGLVYSAGVALGADEKEISALKIGSHFSQAQHQANINAVKEVYKDNPVLADILSGAYEIMYNRGNSLVTAMTVGQFMPKVAGDGKIASFLNNILSATPIAISAASDALERAIERNANPTQLAIIFGATLLAESWTEGIEFGHIEEAGKLLLTKDGITTFLKNYIPNALSEVVGESANDLIENAADYWVKYINNPDYQTEHDNAVKKALAEDDTLTPEQAEALVHQAEIDGVLHTAIISFFSPGADVVAMTGNTLTTYTGYALEAREYNQNATGKHAKKKTVRDIRLEHEAAEAAAEAARKAAEEAKKNPKPVAEETVSEPVEPAAQPEQYPVAGPEETQRRSHAQAMDAYDSNIILLEDAIDANATTQAAAIASAIDTGNTYMAQAAAAKLNLGMVEAIMVAGRQMNLNIETLSTGLQLAALGNGQCAEILNNGVSAGMSATEIATQLATAVASDMQNPGVAHGVAAGIHDARVDEEFKRLMATGLADPAIEAQAKIDAAREATRVAEEQAEIKNNELDAARKGVSDAAAAVAADPINDGNQMTGALAKMTSASAVAQEYAQKLDKARKDQQKVEDENRKAIESTTAYMRQQAETTVSQQEAVEAEQARVAAEQAQAEAQARAEAERAEQMSRNITTLQTEEFVEKYYPDATEEQKEDIAQRIDYMKQQTSAEAILDRAQFVKSLSNKFGTKIRVADTTEGGTKARSNAYVDVNTGEIVVDHNSTMTDIIYAVLPHELMHLAEKSGNYKALADTLLQIKYGKGVTYDSVLQAANGGDRSGAMATAVADLLARKTLYDERLGSTHTNEYALQETVADLMGGLFRSGENGGVNSDLVNRLVAEEPNVAKRIMNAIKSFIRKMAGFNDPALTQAQMAVDMLNEALKERTASTTTKKQTNQTQQRTYVSVENALGADGWKVESNWAKDFSSDNGDSHYTVYDKNGNDVASVTARGKIVYFSPNNLNKEQAMQVRDAIGQSLVNAGYTRNSDGSFRFSLGETTIASDDNGEPLATELPGGTVALDTEKFSLSTFNAEEQSRVRDALLNAEDENGAKLFTEDEVDKYMTNALGIASMIAADRTRLDFEADKDQVFLKKNQDYYFTLDASTLCAKRLLYQGTFNAIQKMMPNEALMPDDLIDLVNIMREMGYETPCGICYVESRRRWLDKYAQEWLDSFKGIKGEPMPTLADLTTSDGLSEMNVPGSPKYAPQTRQAFIDAMSAKGSANPKVVQLRTEYNGDIRKLSDTDIQKVKDIGGLRIQSFSDFETPHLLDMIQAVYDMAAVGLTSQAYTKVPNFAWVFGDTGIKINLSLIGKGTGLDADGNLVFDNVEGMNIDDAMRLRDRYSKNVGTILVGINDEHIIAAMGDPRIDFIIPFHKSGWSHGELSRIPVLNSYKDYTATQNEQYILEANIVKEKGKGQKAVDNWIAKNGEKYPGYKVIDEGNGQFTIEYRDGYKSESFTKHKERTGEKLSNFEPVGANQYWNFDESGEWNARKYLQMCAESKRLPKFYQFLVDNGDGSFSLPEGNDKRSTAIREGYWKTLIDFKMYENDGYGRTKEDGTRTEVKGSRQTEVTPNVNMQQAERVMNEHKLGRQMPKRADGTDGPFIPMKSNNDLPTAEPAAAEFAEFLKYKRQRQEKLTRERLAMNPKKESDDARNKRIAREGAEIYQTYYGRNAFGASANIPLMDQTSDTSTEEPVQSQQSLMAIDPETGETVDIRHSLSDTEIDMDEVEKAVADYIASMSDDELLDYLGLSLPKSWRSEEQVQEFKQEVKSRKQLNAEYDTAIKNGDIAKAGELADEAAKKAGYTLKGIHRTNGEFTVFDKSKQTGERGKTLGNAFYISSPAGSEYDSDSYGKNRMEVYVKTGKMFNLHDGLSRQKSEKVYDKYFAPFVQHDYDDIHKKHVIGQLQKGYKVMDYIDEAAEKNGTTTDEIFKWLGYNSIKDGPQYAIFDPSQIKSADPVTYDDEGNAIPLGKRFKKANDDIRYSLPSDAPYLAAVERGEMDEAQQMVDEAAKEAGYAVKLYHGSDEFGFTSIDPRKGDDLISFFATDNPDVAKTYSWDKGIREVKDRLPFTEKDLKTDRGYFRSDKGILEYLDKLGIEYKEGFKDEYGHDAVEIVEWGHPLARFGIDPSARPFRGDYTDIAYELYRRYLEKDNIKSVLGIPPQEHTIGTYQLYGNADGMLEVDANGKQWNSIPYDLKGILAQEREQLLAKNPDDEPIPYEWEDDLYGGESNTRQIARYAKDRGYSGVVIKNVHDNGGKTSQKNVPPSNVYIFFDPQRQVKSADTVTYDDNGNVIPLSERFNDQNEDIRYSLPSPEILDQQIQNFFNQRYSISAPLEGQKGPSSSTAGTAERQFGGGMLQESEMDTFAKEVVREYGRYFPDTNLDQIKRAVLWVRSNKLTKDSDGLTESMQKVSDNKFDYRSADGQARMVALMAIAVAKNDVAAQTVLADAFNRQGTDLGRALQSRKLFRMMTPQGRIATIDKMLKDEQARLEQKGVKVDLKFSDWVYMAAAAATEEGDFTKVRQMAAEELADQLPANWKDRIRSIRMLSMLGNPRTHIRNIIGNALFVPAVSLKNKMGAAAEMLAGVEQGERTKTLRLRVDKDIREFAEWDAKQHKDDLTGDSRWNERDIVRREQKLFKGKFAWLQSLSDFNSNLLEKEDWAFLRGHYTRALGGWMQANGYTVEQIKSHPELLEKGRAYALNEAQKATYRDFNAVANKLNQLSRGGGPVGFIVDAALPFKKTPANILKRGIEYSPIGLAKSLSADIYNWKKGNLTTNQLIDDICSGLTGTGIMAMGALLSSLGIVTVGMDDDDDRFETERGGQKYAVNLGKLLGIKIDGQDVTYTMDWAAPMSMPFFVGAAVMHQLQEEKDGYTFEDFLNDSSSIAEPVFNLSMLEGVNSLFETSKNEETNSLTQIGAKILSNYATSYVPSLLGGITRTFDPVRRKSFVKSGESGGPMGTFRYAWEQTENKIPGLSQTNIPYRNSFGEADESSFLEKAFENFISPGYVSVTRNDPVIEELERLYGSSDVSDERKTALVPKLPNKAVSGTALEPEQYDAITVQRGQTAKNLMSELMKTDYYKNASDEDRAIMMADVWTYATQTAQNDTVGRKMETWVLNSRTNPVQSIINRSKKTIVSETQSGWKAEAVQAVKAEDYDALDVCIEGLKDAGVKDAKSSVKSAISSEYKAQYIMAYQRGAYDELLAIEDTLENTGLFRQSDFEKWLDTMNAQISDEEI